MIAELTAFMQVQALLLNVVFVSGEGMCLFSYTVLKLVIGVCTQESCNGNAITFCHSKNVLSHECHL